MADNGAALPEDFERKSQQSLGFKLILRQKDERQPPSQYSIRHSDCHADSIHSAKTQICPILFTLLSEIGEAKLSSIGLSKAKLWRC